MSLFDRTPLPNAIPWASRIFPLGTALSMVVCCLIVLANPYPRGDLQNTYADHLRNTFSSWAFLHAGPRVFWEPLGTLGPTVPARERHMIWPSYPVVYPPGMLVLFAPLAVAENLAGVGSETIGRWAILGILVFAHLAFFAYARGLRAAGHPWPLRILLLYWLYSALILFSLNGEYDAAYLLPLILALDALREARPRRTLALYSIALFVHFRAIAFAPIFVASWLHCARDLFRPAATPAAHTRRARLRTAASLAVPTLLVLASLATLAATFTSLGQLSVTNPAFSLDGVARPGALMLAAASVVPALVLLALGLPLIALQVAVLAGFFLASREMMLWHLLALFPLALFARPRGSAGVLLSLFFTCWIYLVYGIMDHAPNIRILKDRVEWMLEDAGWIARGRALGLASEGGVPGFPP